MREEWKKIIILERKEKDRFFAKHWQSPIKPEDRKKFKGLRYYPINPSLRFKLDLYEHDDKKVIEIADTKRFNRYFIRWGEFRFTVKKPGM